MGKKLLKKSTIVMLIIAIIASDFFLLGKSLISYALETDNKTNNENVEYSVYFKNEEGEKITTKEVDINSKDIKLYAQIAVKKEGYFNGKLEIVESNFKLKEESESTAISKIEGNKIELNQINAGNTVEIEIGIEPKTSDEMMLEELTQESKIKLTGKYMEESYKGKDIEGEKTVNLKLKVDAENTKAEVEKEIITNKLYNVNGENKRIIQMSLKTKITNNNYPVKQTTIIAKVPEQQKENLENIKIMGLETQATNGKTDVVEIEDNENEVTLDVKNDGEKITWKRGVCDEYIITYIYNETAEVSGVELKADVEIEVYNESDKLKEEITEVVATEEKSGIIASETQIDQNETYKGQLYENVKIEEKKEIAFNTSTKIVVKQAGVTEIIKVKSGKEKYLTTGEELEANTRFIKTYISYEEFEKFLGNDGYIEIKNGENTIKITQESTKDENGNIVIEYDDDVRDIEIVTSSPITEGKMEFIHEKAITGDTYSTEQVKTITSLKTINNLTACVGEISIVENSSDAVKVLKETFTKAELEVNKANLTTMETNKDVILGVKLNTYGLQYDLYKNPIIKIKLPETVKGINVTNIKKLYGDEFGIAKAVYNNEQKTIEVILSGEQLKYAESDVKQLYLQITLDMSLTQIEESRTDKIIMTYTNENALIYENDGIVEKDIDIIAQKPIVQSVEESQETIIEESSNENTNEFQTDEIKMETSLTATVGQDVLKNDDTVKAGEVIRYKITVKNIGETALSDVNVKGLVPEGTVLVVPEEDFEYSGTSYYEEKIETKEVSEIVKKLETGKEYIMEYEVRVKMDIIDGTKTSNKATVVCGDYSLDSNVLNTELKESKIRITAKSMYDTKGMCVVGDKEFYIIFIENLTDEPIDMNVDLLVSGQDIETIIKGDDEEEYNGQINMDTIEPGEKKGVKIISTVVGKTDEVSILALATDKKGNLYRSNKLTQKLEEVKAKIEITTPNNGEYINIGDEVIYNLEVENIASIPQGISILDNVPEELKIKEILVDGEVQLQSSNSENQENFVSNIANNVNYTVFVEAGKKANISIKSEVKEPEEQFNMKTITNSAKVAIKEEVKDTSEEVTHIIKGNTSENMKNIISGVAWLDSNQNGQKDSDESILPDITVRLLNANTNKLADNKEGNIMETKTNKDGTYIFSKLNEGEYIVIFEYDTTKYEPTIYMKEGVSSGLNSKVVGKIVTVDGQVKGNAATDVINLTENIFDINIGLKENLKYDLELGKYISKVIVQNKKGTKTYEYEDKTFEKVEINSKQINGSVVVLEYTIKVKNTGQIAGYVTNIRDYLPSGVTFSSELNPNWYLSGGDLYTKSLANTKIEPGEIKEIKLILTKTMTSNNIGLINNRAEIVETYNEYGKLDIDSIVNNQVNGEDDMGTADVIIGISTGMKIMIYTIIMIINTGLIVFAIYLIFKKNKRTN